MTIEDTISPEAVFPAKTQRCLPESHRFASSILTENSHYLNIALTSPHWQLKDLLVSSSYSSMYDDYNNTADPTVYFPYKSRIFSFNLNAVSEGNYGYADNNNDNTDKEFIHTDSIDYSSIQFHSNPRCLKQLDDILAVGGINNTSAATDPSPIGLHKGAFSIYNNETKITENIQVGEFINNCVSLNKVQNSNNHYVSYLCNNDKHLYKFDLTPSKVVQYSNPIYLKTALNHSILSHDNKTLITVGDSNKIYISYPEENNPQSLNFTDFEIVLTSGDCGFSTCFLPNNYQFITCFQNGIALIYDLRNLKNPIHSINSTRPKSQPGAFRVIKSSKNNDNLICISEHQGRIHLIDGRNFNNHSVLMLPKYLYNVPPKIDENDGDDDKSRIFGKYPISVAKDRKSYNQWYNQPTIKDIDEFKELANFGGDLNLGYLESYRSYDSRYNNHTNSTYTYYGAYNSRVNLDDQINPYKTILQGSFDRENLLKRRLNYSCSPHLSNLLNYNQSSLAPLKIKKVGGNINEIKRLNDFWWSDNKIKYTDYWPWGKKAIDEEVQNEDSINDNDNQSSGSSGISSSSSSSSSSSGNMCSTYNIMETPERDPFFYVDSDIEINGMEIINRKGKSCLCIGTKEGMVIWDINDWNRRCFPTFDYV